eukprot:PITA_23436
MKVFSWNVRGLNGQTKQRLLKRNVQHEKPDLILVQESKCANNIIQIVNRKVGRRLENMSIDSQGWEGGLVTWWNPHVLKILSSEASRHLLALECQVIGNSDIYLCINVYGPQKLEEKLKSIKSVMKLKQRYPIAKVIIRGDFNMITLLSEKKGGIRKLNKDSEAFVEFIMLARLVDIQPRSGAYTWNNRRGGERQIASRLDRFLVSESLLLEGVIVYSDILPCGGSDHWPISLTATIQGTPRNKSFRFEKFWLEHSDFIQLVEKWWQEPVGIRGTKMYKLQGKLKHIKYRIKEWNIKVFGNIFKEKIKIEEQLEKIHNEWIQGISIPNTVDQEKRLMQQWQDRSTLDYRGVNKILSLKNEQGESIENHQGIATLLTEHFNNIAQESEIDRTEAIGNLIKSIPNSIANEQNQALSREVSLEEVEEAVKEMPNDKAPGPDGFTINFYKAC